jgi:hypothetical protein
MNKSLNLTWNFTRSPSLVITVSTATFSLKFSIYQDSVCIVSCDSYNQALLFPETTLTDRAFFIADAGHVLCAVANEVLKK